MTCLSKAHDSFTYKVLSHVSNWDTIIDHSENLESEIIIQHWQDRCFLMQGTTTTKYILFGSFYLALWWLLIWVAWYATFMQTYNRPLRVYCLDKDNVNLIYFQIWACILSHRMLFQPFLLLFFHYGGFRWAFRMHDNILSFFSIWATPNLSAASCSIIYHFKMHF